MNYTGVIIEESLEDKDFLDSVKILNTKIEKVNERHQTPWIKQWTLHTVEVAEGKADEVAEKISKALDSKHDWYADFKNDTIDFIIFKNKVFKIDRTDQKQYAKVRAYGISLGIPEYQVGFKKRGK